MKNSISCIVAFSILFFVIVACRSSSSDGVQPSISKSDSISSESPSARRQFAKELQSDFDGDDRVSIYTEGANAEVLHIEFTNLSSSDNSKADLIISQFRSKIKGYGFKKVEFSNGRRTIAKYDF